MPSEDLWRTLLSNTAPPEGWHVLDGSWDVDNTFGHVFGLEQADGVLSVFVDSKGLNISPSGQPAPVAIVAFVIDRAEAITGQDGATP